MKKWITITLSLLTALSLMACSHSSDTGSEKKSTEKSQTVTDTEDKKQNAGEKKESENGQSGDAGSKDTVVVYFSGTGNTKKVAEKLSEELPADILEIVPAEAYTSEDLDYNDDSCRANQEMNDESARPEIGNDLGEVLDYKTIYIGYPIWWGTRPRIIETFLDTYDLSGKTIYTFCTSGGSGIETSVSDLEKEYPDLDIQGGYRFDANADSTDIQKGIDALTK